MLSEEQEEMYDEYISGVQRGVGAWCAASLEKSLCGGDAASSAP